MWMKGEQASAGKYKCRVGTYVMTVRREVRRYRSVIEGENGYNAVSYTDLSNSEIKDDGRYQDLLTRAL